MGKIPTSRRDDDREEARRILDRVARETEPSGVSLIGSAGRDLQRHFGAADVDPSDRIEYWGTRIGRALGFVIALGMMVWLAVYVTGHG